MIDICTAIRLILGFLVTFWAGVWYGTHDLLNLVDGGRPREQSLSQQHLSEDTAKAPHVYTCCVPLDNDAFLLKKEL